MAITKLSYPLSDGGGGLPTPVYNPVTFSVSSTNSGQSNFKYICDVYVAGATSPVRKVSGTDPDNGYGLFDISGILQSFLASNPPTDGINTFFDCTSSYIGYTVKFGEQYGASSAITNYPNLETHSGVVYVGAYSRGDFENSTDPTTNYRLQNSSRKFLTSAPRINNSVNGLVIGDNELFYLYFLQASGSVPYNAVIKTYDATGSLIQTVKYGTTFGSASTIQYVACGTKNFAALTGAETRFSASVGLPVITASTSYYTVHIETSGTTQISEAFRINIENNCTIGTAYRLHWQNKQGGFDQYTFGFDSQKKAAYEKSTAMKKDGEWYGSGIIYPSKQRLKSQFSTIASDKIFIKSGWISEDYAPWFEELFASPEVYYVDSNDNFYSVTVLDAEYTFKTWSNDKMFNIELTIEISYNRYRQKA